MVESIGEKIKKLRKALSMTQTELAGNEMTKSMLSQIENNQAFPSMKNLQYISQRLGKPVSYFFDSPDIVNNDLHAGEINSILKKADMLIEKRETQTALQLLNELVKKYELKDGTKIYGDYLYTFGKCLIYLNKHDEGEEQFKKAIEIFIAHDSYIEASKAYIEFTDRLMGQFEFEEALNYIAKAEEMYKKSAYRDMIYEIEMLYLKSYINSAIGHTKETLEELDKAIEITNESGTYYKTDELYRMKSVIFFIEGKYEDFLYNIKKAMQFAEFTENKANIGRIALNLCIYYINANDIQNAEKYIKIYEDSGDRERFLYYIQKAKIHYLMGEYEKAYESIRRVNYGYHITHKFDYLFLWTGKIYEGMILSRIGRIQEAVDAIKEAVSKLELLPSSINLGFAYKNLSALLYETGDYKGAYEALSKSTECGYKGEGLI